MARSGPKSALSSRLRHQLEIRRKVQVDNDTGGSTTSWPVVATPWAEVEGLGGREVMLDEVLRSIETYRFTIRWRDDLQAGDQVRYGSVDLNIKPPTDPDGRRETLVFIADTEGVEAMPDA